MTTTTAPRTARALRRAARGARVQHLIAADEHSLLELEALLATLPLCATGRVFVEVSDATQIAAMAAPARMTVTWLPRSARRGMPPRARGEALSRAVCAWADEMLCETSSEDTQVTLLGGYLGTADIVEHLTERTLIDSAQIHTPARFGLLVR